MKPYTITEVDLALLADISGGFNATRVGKPITPRWDSSVSWAKADALTTLVMRLKQPEDELVELPAWSGSSNRRTPIANGIVYTMRVPYFQPSFRASLAIVPAGSGSIGGNVSAARGYLPWDGTGGGAGGMFSQDVAGAEGDMWFTFRLGVDQPSTDVNILVQGL